MRESPAATSLEPEVLAAPSPEAEVLAATSPEPEVLAAPSPAPEKRAPSMEPEVLAMSPLSPLAAPHLSMAAPAHVADLRLADQATPTETFGHRRLDLQTDEARVTLAADTPGPLTAGGLASVRRVAGASLFPGGGDLTLGHDDAWDSWAEGLDDDDGRMERLDDDLRRRTSRLGRCVSRLLTNRGDQGAERTLGD